ncbi:MAG: response regulator [Rhizobacter sp.]|nr:response regulator [Chlorobiales bacterium]
MTDMQSVLIVDDDPEAHRVFRTALRDLPIEFEAAFDGAECLEKLQNRRYDLVLLDMVMPNVAGLDVLQTADAINLPLPIVVVCSSITERNVIMQALSLGASCYLFKTDGTKKLRETICEYLVLTPPQPAPRDSPGDAKVSGGTSGAAAREVPLDPSLIVPLVDTSFQKPPVSSGLPPEIATLQQAMAYMTMKRLSGILKLRTPFGVGGISYEVGRLKTVSFNNVHSIDALEAIRAVGTTALWLE